MIMKWFGASLHLGTGIVHFLEVSWIDKSLRVSAS